MPTSWGTRRFAVQLFLYKVRRVYNPTNIGFPPADAYLRDWLVFDSGDRDTVQKRLHGFIYSLLMVTREQLETIAEKQGDYLAIAARITC